MYNISITNSTFFVKCIDTLNNIVYAKQGSTVKQQNIVERRDMAYKIKEIREKKNLSQAELSRLSGVSRATIIRIENDNDVIVNTKTLQHLADALNVSVKYLFLP